MPQHVLQLVDRGDDLLAELGVRLDQRAAPRRVSGPGFSSTEFGIPILPMSWKSAPSSSRFSVSRVEAELAADAQTPCR